MWSGRAVVSSHRSNRNARAVHHGGRRSLQRRPMKWHSWRAATLAIVIILGLLAPPARSTAQIPDEIDYEGNQEYLLTNPLERYFGPDHPRPRFVAPHTACWRGYIAHWAIKKGILYLTGIQAWMSENSEKHPPVGFEHVFPGQAKPLKAAWFSGTLRIAAGPLVDYVHSGYGSRYEKEVFLTIKAGHVTDRWVIDRRPPATHPPPASLELPWPVFTDRVHLPAGLEFFMEARMAQEKLAAFGPPRCSLEQCLWSVVLDQGVIQLFQRYRAGTLMGFAAEYVLDRDYSVEYRQKIQQLKNRLADGVLPDSDPLSILSEAIQFTAKNQNILLELFYQEREHTIICKFSMRRE